MGKSKSSDSDESSALATSIISTIRSSENGKSMDIKELRSAVLTADGAEVDKSSKKSFKAAVKLLEKDDKVSLSSDGIVKLAKSERGGDNEKKEKKKEKDKKRKRESKEKGAKSDGDDDDDEDENLKKKKQASVEDSQGDDGDEEENTASANEEEDRNDNDTSATNNNSNEDPKDKNKPCKNNPQGITRLFLGNLPFAVSEPILNTHLNDCVTHIKWITDKLTGKFYGSAFVEIRNSKDAAKVTAQHNGSNLMGRPIKINYAPVRSGEEGDWPPRSKVITGGKVANAGNNGGQAGGSGIKAMSVKPEGCSKLFIGNLSYEIDDEGITKFFMGVEAEVKSVRWLHHKESGDFKGCGFVDFWNSEACEKAATLNGKSLLGRPIRVDWTE